MDRLPEDLVNALHRARRIMALTGAGISAESGMPTFREAQTGLWARFQPEELATPEAFERHPRRVWEWYAWRRSLAAQARPNVGHRTLVGLADRVPDFTLVTQNVDNLHQRAGSREVVELHGNILRTRCSQDGGPVTEWADGGTLPPLCPRCGAPLRPDVVWFGEALPADAVAHAWRAAEAAELCLVVGTSALVHPAASLPLVTREHGGLVVEVNPEPTPLTPQAAWSLRGRAGDVLPRLLAAAWPD
ncbi:MAG: NAD-dependent deacylase [Verrucomicrobiales bacterium]|nr:NAD-dependent deacylase [Verrucomicrobiales bacterium]MCP5526044.1 NAD-dependent deacylase [Verrucomicrobiales bacterium]